MLVLHQPYSIPFFKMKCALMIPRILGAIPCYRHNIHKLIFLETNFLNKINLDSFQSITCTNIPHRVLDRQQKRNLSLYNKGFQNFCVKLCYRHYKKINLKFFVFTRHFFPSELTIQT